MLLGVLADCHGCAKKLAMGIKTLRRRNVGRIIHLGDVADTLKPETVDECIQLLIENEIMGVMGNHEYSLIKHHFKRYPGRFSAATKQYVSSLPQVMELSSICFTHFSPEGGVYGLFAPTDEGSYEQTLRKSRWPVLINGHSHDPRVYRQLDGTIEGLILDLDKPFQLEDGARYILTCGALEDLYCAVFDLEARRFEVVSMKD